MKSLGYGKGYQYAHDAADAVTGMECLPERLQGRRYYRPTARGLREDAGRTTGTLERAETRPQGRPPARRRAVRVNG